jgi:hypothetical protein
MGKKSCLRDAYSSTALLSGAIIVFVDKLTSLLSWAVVVVGSDVSTWCGVVVVVGAVKWEQLGESQRKVDLQVRVQGKNVAVL